MGLLDSAIGAISSDDDGGCDWICDSCGVYMNDQLGFNVSSGSWYCKECGSWNDVSEDNVFDDCCEEDPYFASYRYYVDEQERIQEEEEDLRELGIDPNDD